MSLIDLFFILPGWIQSIYGVCAVACLWMIVVITFDHQNRKKLDGMALEADAKLDAEEYHRVSLTKEEPSYKRPWLVQYSLSKIGSIITALMLCASLTGCNTTRTVNADGSVTETKSMDPALRDAATASAIAISAAVTARVVNELNKPSK